MAQGTAMRAVPRSRYAVFLSLAIGGCLIDLATKRWMFAWLGMPDPHQPPSWLWDGVFGFQTSLNEGALFGMGQGMRLVFVALSIAAALGITYWLFAAGAARDLLLTMALACVMAGILGNLYDRLGLPGLTWDANSVRSAVQQHRVGDPVYAVRDWALLMIGRFHWPNFNVADSLLVCGAGMLILHAYLHGRQEQDDAGNAPAEGTA
jgi:signal peptidase II